MRLIIAGTRGLKATEGDILAGLGALGLTPKDVFLVVSGGCHGPDLHGESWAKRAGIMVRRYPADWASYGRLAGPIRNKEMAENADALLAFWDGKSRGTKNMIDEARALGLKVHVVEQVAP